MSNTEDKNAGYSFISTIISGAILGFFIDKYFETKPWALIFFLLFSFVYATYRAQKSASQASAKAELENDTKKQGENTNEKDDKNI